MLARAVRSDNLSWGQIWRRKGTVLLLYVWKKSGKVETGCFGLVDRLARFWDKQNSYRCVESPREMASWRLTKGLAGHRVADTFDFDGSLTSCVHSSCG
jgi:hypothetical protein